MNKDDDKYFDEVQKHKVTCKCSHRIDMTNAPYLRCYYCGRLVFRDKKTEYEWRLRSLYGITKEN